MDYLFGGFTAYAAEVAGQDAAFVATKAAKDAVLVASGQAGGGGGGGPFKRRQYDINDLSSILLLGLNNEKSCCFKLKKIISI